MKKIILLMAAMFALVSVNAVAVPKAAENEHGTVTSAPATTPVPKKEKAAKKKPNKPAKKSSKTKSSKKSAKTAK